MKVLIIYSGLLPTQQKMSRFASETVGDPSQDTDILTKHLRWEEA